MPSTTPTTAGDPQPEDFLPLHRDTFQILVALADRDRHGYSILRDVEARTEGKVRLSPSTLYASIRRLLEGGLIEELAERPDPEHDDERRRYYRLTPLGRGVAMAEARRLDRLLADARASGLLPAGKAGAASAASAASADIADAAEAAARA
jgi:DNA-binding PadR family transcriptional regulator